MRLFLLSLILWCQCALAQFGGVQQPMFSLVSSSTHTNCGALDAVVTAWVQRVIDNGGAEPSQQTKDAVNCFYKGLVADGLSAKMLDVCCFVPDNLIASTTPLLTNASYVLWTNVAFDVTNLTVNGLKGNGTSKYLKTGFNPNRTGAAGEWSVGQESGISVYVLDVETNSAANVCEVGARNAVDSSGDYYVMASFGGAVVNAQSGYHGDAAPATNSGFYSGNRYDNTRSSLFGATTNHGFMQIGATDPTAGKVVGSYNWSEGMYVFAWNDVDGGQHAGAFNPRTISFVAMHLPLTFVLANRLYARVQEMRIALDGGYITSPGYPPASDSLLASYDVNALASSDGTLISSLPDDGPFNYDLGSSGTSRPYWTNNAGVINGEGFAWFDGSNDYLTNLFATTYPQPTHIFIVSQNLGVAGVSCAMFGSDNTTFQASWFFNNTGPQNFAANAAASPKLEATYVPNWTIWEVLFDSTGSYVKTNNVTNVSGSAGTSGRKSIVLGNHATLASHFSGGIAWAGFYTNALNSVTASNLVQSLGTRYGITTYTRN